jgi:hypothetical protein
MYESLLGTVPIKRIRNRNFWYRYLLYSQLEGGPISVDGFNSRIEEGKRPRHTANTAITHTIHLKGRNM